MGREVNHIKMSFHTILNQGLGQLLNSSMTQKGQSTQNDNSVIIYSLISTLWFFHWAFASFLILKLKSPVKIQCNCRENPTSTSIKKYFISVFHRRITVKLVWNDINDENVHILVNYCFKTVSPKPLTVCILDVFLIWHPFQVLELLLRSWWVESGVFD